MPRIGTDEARMVVNKQAVCPFLKWPYVCGSHWVLQMRSMSQGKRMCKTSTGFLGNAALVIIFSVAAPFFCGSAQTPARSVRGVVTDREGAPLSSTVVQIEDAATLYVRSFMTRNDGTYFFMDLDPDRDYILKAHYRNAWSRAKTLSRFDSRKDATVNLKIDILREE
ncbi:MAG: hypothetical protein C5B51_19480 [Terriglobia bacterium]|nr:MAG: hypothetical protein C5B51_19480 [Terriglobia bacterium]